jgi:hypothetical protein
MQTWFINFTFYTSDLLPKVEKVVICYPNKHCFETACSYFSKGEFKQQLTTSIEHKEFPGMGLESNYWKIFNANIPQTNDLNDDTYAPKFTEYSTLLTLKSTVELSQVDIKRKLDIQLVGIDFVVLFPENPNEFYNRAQQEVFKRTFNDEFKELKYYTIKKYAIMEKYKTISVTIMTSSVQELKEVIYPLHEHFKDGNPTEGIQFSSETKLEKPLLCFSKIGRVIKHQIPYKAAEFFKSHLKDESKFLRLHPVPLKQQHSFEVYFYCGFNDEQGLRHLSTVTRWMKAKTIIRPLSLGSLDDCLGIINKSLDSSLEICIPRLKNKTKAVLEIYSSRESHEFAKLINEVVGRLEARGEGRAEGVEEAEEAEEDMTIVPKEEGGVDEEESKDIEELMRGIEEGREEMEVANRDMSRVSGVTNLSEIIERMEVSRGALPEE